MFCGTEDEKYVFVIGQIDVIIYSWPKHKLAIDPNRILIAPLVSSNSSIVFFFFSNQHKEICQCYLI